MNRSPIHPVDSHVGASIRARRKEMKLSQETLAKRVGITFQQIQKYEHGVNRVSASMLYLIAQELNCPVDHFFPEQAATEAPAALVLEPAERDVVVQLRALRPDQRKSIENILATVSERAA